MKLAIPLLAALLTAWTADAASESVQWLYRSYQQSFGHPATGLMYHNRLDDPRGVEVLASPPEIARGEVDGRAMPHGYGSGIQDIALENGQLLFALCEAHERTEADWIAAEPATIFSQPSIRHAAARGSP
jgi:hypothetical protein